jgi:glycosyltransferase involved in cell wall biosynthesis
MPSPGAVPRITIVVPVKDPHPGYFDEALGSARDQTSPNWRLLIVAEPAELEAIRRLLPPWTDDPRVRLVPNEGRRLAGAVNTAMAHAETDFVALLLADDLWYPEAIAVLEDHIERHPDADFFHSGRRIVHDRGVTGAYPAREHVVLEDFRTMAPVKHLLCWRRAKGIEAGGLDERFHAVGPDDFDFPWTMAEHGARFQAVDACLYIYRDHRDWYRLTTHEVRSEHARELYRVFRKHGLSRADARERVRLAKHEYLRQKQYTSRIDVGLRRLLRRGPREWQDPYTGPPPS